MPQTFKHPRVRDLAWVIGSPAMLEPGSTNRPVVSAHHCQDAFTQALPQLRALDENPAPLLSHLEQHPSHRVGRYFEGLTNYWLRNMTNFEVITNNLQLRKDKQTLGEIDFLFRDNGQLIHWEAAVKYYLQLKPGCEDFEFIGPNTADNLASKLRRLFEKQLPRSTPENLNRALGNLSGADSIKREAFIKGWLFYRPSQMGPQDYPALLNSEHLQGFWIRHAQDALPAQEPDALWSLLAKPYWLAPQICPNQDGLITRQQMEQLLESHFSSRQSPLLIAQLEPCSAGYREILRGFIVPPAWPHLGKKQIQ